MYGDLVVSLVYGSIGLAAGWLMKVRGESRGVKWHAFPNAVGAFLICLGVVFILNLLSGDGFFRAFVRAVVAAVAYGSGVGLVGNVEVLVRFSFRMIHRYVLRRG